MQWGETYSEEFKCTHFSELKLAKQLLNEWSVLSAVAAPITRIIEIQVTSVTGSTFNQLRLVGQLQTVLDRQSLFTFSYVLVKLLLCSPHEGAFEDCSSYFEIQPLIYFLELGKWNMSSVSSNKCTAPGLLLGMILVLVLTLQT